MRHDWEREELARAALEQADLGPPVDPYDLAKRLGWRVEDGGRGCAGICLDEMRLILVDEHVRRERRSFAVAHELGHHLQRAAGWEDPARVRHRDEAGANYLASALLLPRFEFEIDLRRHGWDLLALKSRHRYASFEALARRVAALRPARVFVFDQPRRAQSLPRSYSIPPGIRPTEDERTAASEAAREGSPVETVAGVTGWPVVEHDWVRVITLSSPPDA